MLGKYGDHHNNCLQSVQESKKKTYMKKYGVDYQEIVFHII